MTLERQDITESFYSGNAKTLHVTIYDDAGALKDLTGATITYMMFHRTNNTPVYISKSTNAGDGEIEIVGLGLCDVHINSNDTAALFGTFRHHLNVVDANNKEETAFTGKVEIHYTPARRYETVSIKSYLEGTIGV